MNQLFDQITIKTCLAGCCTAASWLFGGFDAALLALVVLYIADFALGLGRALENGSYNSDKFRHGVGKFFVYSLAVILANMVDVTLDESLPSVFAYVREFMVLYLASNEFLSVSIHLAQLNIHVIPKRLTERIASFRDEFDPIQERYGYGHGSMQHHSLFNSARGAKHSAKPKGKPIAREEDYYG